MAALEHVKEQEGCHLHGPSQKRAALRNNRTEKKDGQEVEVGYTGIDRSVLLPHGVLGKDAMPIIRDIYETPI